METGQVPVQDIAARQESVMVAPVAALLAPRPGADQLAQALLQAHHPCMAGQTLVRQP